MPTRVLNEGGGVVDRGFVHGIDEIYSGDQRFFVGKKVMFKDVREEEEEEEEDGKIGVVKNSCKVMFKDVREEEEEDGKIGLVKNSCKNICCSDESSSSIGKNSDLSENSWEKSGDGEEVQSSYKGPLASMETLEEVLPIRRGISRFYNGKSKSFASLGDVSSSMKDIAKPENAYMRKRRNLLASNLSWDKARSSPLRGNGGGVAKRVTSSSSSRTTLALAVVMSNVEGECNSAGGSSSPRKDFSSWRSFSLADLQHCAAVAMKPSR